MKVHERVVPGQVWRSNDARSLRAVRVVSVVPSPAGTRDMDRYLLVENIVSRRTTVIRRGNFTTGVRGWSLDKDVSAAGARS